MTAHRLYLSVALNSTGSAARSWRAAGSKWNRFADWDHYLRSAQLAHEGIRTPARTRRTLPPGRRVPAGRQGPVAELGHPVRAGASDAGIDLAAKHSDIVYASLLHKQSAFDYQSRLRERALAHGRDPDDLRLIPGLTVILGETREEAYRKHEALHGHRGEDGLIADFLERNWAVDLDHRRIDPDKPLDPALFTWTEDQKRPVGFVKSFAELAAAEPITPRQLVRRVEGGHRLAVGTPREVADTILDWWSSGAVAGFNIHIPVLPDGIEEFNRLVIPLLQESGAFPSAYDGSTIRERLKLPDPRNHP